ncbi:MAG: aldehyde dehydrogenase family protein [Synechococcaceae cyanobacterium SM2_3_60]|nr:aldehyde dehydrogenase family protein [Synechococcaceae cyanobacterium SM2_3_60]
MQERFLWCAGADVAGAAVHTVVNPFNGVPVTQLHLADGAQLEVAIARAATTFEATWRQTPAFKRADILLRTASLISDHASELATQIALEAGKPITTAQGEVQRAIATFTEAAHVCRSLHGEQIPMDIVAGGSDRFAISFRQPLGVVAAIAPFNFPLNLVAHKVAPALAAGNTVVLKPPSDAPSAALILARLLQAAGLPPGCLEVVPCRGNVAERLASHPQVQVLTFTGSAAVGWHLRSLAAESG